MRFFLGEKILLSKAGKGFSGFHIRHNDIMKLELYMKLTMKGPRFLEDLITSGLSERASHPASLDPSRVELS